MPDSAEIARASYEAFNAGDVARWLTFWHPDAELHDLPQMPERVVYRGHAGLRRWVESMRDAAGDAGLCFQVEEISDFGDRVLTRVRAQAQGARSGISVETIAFHVFELEDGVIRIGRGFLSEAEARTAAGLPG